MKNKQISKGAFSEAMAAYRYFDKVDEGCGYERLQAQLWLIRDTYGLTYEELGVVEKWAYRKYYEQK